MEVLTGEQMRRVDRRAIDDLGIPSLELMEAAGRGVAEALLGHYPDTESLRVAVICGKGNNGGDGFVAARHLRQLGVEVDVVLLASADALKGDAAVNFERLIESSCRPREVPDEAAWADLGEVLLEGSPIVIDAILGTGVRGGARGLAAKVIADLGASRARIVSIDVPSGVDADRADSPPVAVAAERTYTLCRPKLSVVLDPASRLAGRWEVLPIGIPDEAVEAEAPLLDWFDLAAAESLMPRRARDAHKGSFGHLLAVAGSRGKSGAAVLLSRGALRSGVGLMTVATPAANQERVAVQQAEVMTEALPETPTGDLAADAAARAIGLLAERDALAIGPGLGTDEAMRAAVIEIVPRAGKPTVIDADGLNAFALAGDDALARLAEVGFPLVLTPHPGEAARLLGVTTAEIQADRMKAVTTLAARTGAVVVLKGDRSLTACPDGRVAINSTGNPGMATAGTGDVLTGCIGALLARGLEARDAARLGVMLHGLAGDLAAGDLGQDGLIAGDVVDNLPRAIQIVLGERKR